MGGFYYKNSEHVKLQPVKSPTELDLRKLLTVLKSEPGRLALEQKSPNDFGLNELTLYGENGHYLVMYGSYQEDGDYLVLTLHNESNVKLGMMNILGESYPACAVVEDFSLVEEVFIEFLATGLPSEQLKK
ncbi:MAG: hypothetical protein HWE24_06000 [Oceanospirillaceae bacterium]|nr:hypothetical protein [Oceanospirillaceae bacterium]